MSAAPHGGRNAVARGRWKVPLAAFRVPHGASALGTEGPCVAVQRLHGFRSALSESCELAGWCCGSEGGDGGVSVPECPERLWGQTLRTPLPETAPGRSVCMLVPCPAAAAPRGDARAVGETPVEVSRERAAQSDAGMLQLPAGPLP